MSGIGKFFTNLTTLSKLILVALVMFGGYMGHKYGLLDKFAPKGNMAKAEMTPEAKAATKAGAPLIRVCVVTWGGYAGGQYFNNGFKASTESRYYKDYGILVEFKTIDDFAASRKAYEADEIDVLWITADSFPCESKSLSGQPKIILQSDWSRGGDAIVAVNGVNKVSDLRKKKVAYARGTPSHTFLVETLKADGMSVSDIEPVEVDSAILAATTFKAGKVDAAIVWSPDDEDCVNAVPGSKILKNTKEATHIIADVFFAPKAKIEKNRKAYASLVEGWMRGAAEINSDPAAKDKAVKILAQGLNIPEDAARKAINNTRLTTLGDNRNFFGLNPEYRGVKGEDLYNRMTRAFVNLKVAPEPVPSWREVTDISFIQSINLAGVEHDPETAIKFAKPASKKASVFAQKELTVTFATGSAILDENARAIIDMGVVDTAKSFGAMQMRIEGNTDNVGSASLNKRLSEKRAASVSNYLVAKYGFDRNKFDIVGNGPNNPVADNKTEEGRAKNRRTTFSLLN